MNVRKILKDYFSFSKKESVAAIVLVLLIGGFIALPYFYKSNINKPVVDTHLQEQVAKIQSANSINDSADEGLSRNFQPSNTIIETKFELFEFDPNTLDAAGWKRLGLRDKTINTIFNYRSKGGKFRKPEDISKIWGLRPIDAERIMPYAKIDAPQNAYAKPTFANKKSPTKTVSIVDINLASPEDMKGIPGMENGLQYRIVKFREKLGGFIAINQIKETYGMNDTAFQLMQPFLKLENITIKKLNINAASDGELNDHPYISKSVAKAIVLYHAQHGNYQSVTDIKKIVFIKEDLFQKIAPYLTVE